MSSLSLTKSLADRDLRANPAYTLCPWDSLPDVYRQSLPDSVDQTAVTGVLVAGPGSPLPDKVVGPGGAALFTRLRSPGRAPDVPTDLLAALVLDGVLEIQTDDGFRCGPAAHEVLLEPPTWPSAPPVAADRLSGLSFDALAYAERLPLDDVPTLTGRLYGYGRVPQSARWNRAYPDPGSVLDLLRSTGLAQHWHGPADASPAADWLSWRRRVAPVAPGRSDLPYKLYISPHVDELADVLPAAVSTLNTTSASRFKLGSDAAGLLRPDKFVVYLHGVEELQAVAAELAQALAGARPHGVPFSAELGGDGLLSWGGDPPGDAGPVGAGSESWRLSVCRRLAEHLVVAKAADVRTIRPAQYALARLAADGVRLPAFAPASLTAPAPEEAVG